MINRKRSKRDFYVYVWLDPRKPGKYVYGEYEFDFEPFYVGAGKGKRFKNFFDTNARNSTVLNKAKEIRKEIKKNPISIVLISNLRKTDSFEMEKIIITIVGRLNTNTGPLLNKAEGGAKSYGWHQSEDTKQNKIAKPGPLNPFYGKKHSDEDLIKMSKPRTKRDKYGHSQSEKTKTKLRLINTGKTHSEETRRKQSMSRKKYLEDKRLTNDIIE